MSNITFHVKTAALSPIDRCVFGIYRGGGGGGGIIDPVYVQCTVYCSQTNKYIYLFKNRIHECTIS
jgi:hypothetical protein